MERTIYCLKAAGLKQPLLSACLEITEVLSSLDAQNSRFMPLSFFDDNISGNRTVPELFEALNLLCTFECAVLDAHGYLEGWDGDPIFLEDEDFSNLLRTGELAHPETGALIHDPMSEVRLYYSIRSGEAINGQF